MLVMSELLVLISKHLKGQLDPPVGNGHVFGSKVVSWVGFSWFLVGFYGFSRWFHGFSWFLVGFHGFSR